MLFWVICIPTRAFVTYLAQRHDLRIPAAVIGGRWLLGYEKGHVGFFGGPAWWKEERPAHGALWSMYALTGSWQFLAMDTVFGAYNFLNHKG